MITSCGFSDANNNYNLNISNEIEESSAALAANQELIGKVPYNVSVNKFGQLSSQIELKTLTSGNGFSPNLSLIYYSSNQKVGYLGYGWTVSGLSQIHRCPDSLYYDGKSGPIDYSNNGKFCLDGKRLVPSDDPVESGAKVYRLASDNFTKIVFNSSYFKAYSKNGEIQTFGSNTNSRTMGKDNKTYSWKLDKNIDRKGNFIKYDYINENNQNYIKKISYGGNSDFNVKPYRFINFSYESNINPQSSYDSGALSVFDKRISNITMSDIEGDAWQYKLNYRSMSQNQGELLNNISLCIANSCIPPTVIDYQESTLNLSPQSLVESYGVDDSNKTLKMARSVVDVNNDGWDDILTLSTSELSVEYGSSDGFAAPVVTQTGLPPTWISRKDPVFIRDINADGWVDILTTVTTTSSEVPRNRTGVYVLFGGRDGLGLANHMTTQLGDIQIRTAFMNLADLDGDNKPEIITFRTRGIFVLKNNGDNFSLYNRTGYVSSEFSYARGWDNKRSFRNVLDINGDGHQDIVGLKYGGIWVSLGSGYNFSTPSNWGASGAQASYNVLDDKRTFADMNNDGLLDVVGFRAGGVFVRLNTGYSFLEETHWLGDFDSNGGWKERNSSRMILDINLDGYQDIIGVRKGLLRVYLGKGRPFNSSELDSSKYDMTHSELSRWQKRYPIYLQDTNADGASEISLLNLFYGIQSYKNSSKPIRLKSIQDAFGKQSIVDYQEGKIGTIYAKKLDLTFPLQSLPHGGYLVSSLRESDGRGGFKKIEYRYEDAILHKQGIGYLGFKKWISIDHSSNTRKEINYSHDYVNYSAGYPIVSSEFWLIDGKNVEKSRTTTLWNYKNLSSQQHHIFSYSQQKVDERFDDEGKLLSQTTTENEFDNLGNLLQSTVVAKDDLGEIKSKTVNSYDSENETNWIIGKITSSTVTAEKIGYPDIVNSAHFEYDNQGLLVKEISEKGTEFESSTTYTRYRNNFGLIDTETREWSSALNGGLSFNSVSTSKNFDELGFLEQSKNEVGLKDKVLTRQPIYRKIIEDADFNDLSTRYSYSKTGNVVSVTTADGFTTWTNEFWCDNSCPSNAVYFIESKTSSGIHTITYKDKLDRTIRTKEKILNARYSCVDTHYNATGTVEKTSIPFICSEGPLYWTQYIYDSQNRIKEERYPDQTKKTIIRSRNTTKIVDRRGNTETKHVSPFGPTQWVENAKGERISFYYDAKNRLIKTIDSGNNEYVAVYNIIGQQTFLNDPDMGQHEYSYNGLGLVYEESDEEGNINRTSYDKLGRPVKVTYLKGAQILSEGSWEYDTATNGLGLLYKTSNENIEKIYSYDELSRLESVNTIINGERFTYSKRYDNLSRPEEIILPSGFQYRYHYSDEGIQNRISSIDNAKTYWQLETQNSFGSPTKFSLGNGTVSRLEYDSKTGLLKNSKVSSNNATVDQRSYTYDPNGNLKSRTDHIEAISESFSYDTINRLERVNRNNSTSLSMTYDKLGNIKSRSDIVGSYQYSGGCNAGPHAVTQANGTSYCYNNIGQMTSSGDRIINYSPQGKPSYIGNRKSYRKLFYGSKSELVKQESVTTNGTEEIFYPQGGELRLKNGKRTWKHYISANVLIEVADDKLDEKYLHRDHLGSVVSITDSQGLKIESLSYNAWGQRRDPKTLDLLLGKTSKSTDRGYTDHIHLDDLNLIHMGGRVYDPVIGRFLSPDPFVQDPFNLQSYNRYSYMWNNPLSGTDPTGYFSIGNIFKGVDKFFSNPAKVIGQGLSKAQKWVRRPENLRMAASVAIQVVATVYAPYLAGYFGQAWVGWATVGAGGYASGYVASNGNHDYARTSMLQSLVSFGIGEKLQGVANIVAHGISGGAYSSYNGGDFASGFAASAGAAGFFDNVPPELSKSPMFTAISSTVIGGINSELTGGNFENGILTSSFTAMFNHLTHYTESGCLIVKEPHYDTVDGGWVEHTGPTIDVPADVKFARELANVYTAPFETAYDIYTIGKAPVKYAVKHVVGAAVAKSKVNKLGPDPKANGIPHTRFKTDPMSGKVTGYTEFDANGNPVKRFRGQGKQHGGKEPPFVLKPKSGKGAGSPLKVPHDPSPLELPLGY